MAGFGFRTNTVFEWNGAQFRIERLQPNGEVLLERLADGQLSIVSQSTLLAEYGNGLISADTEDQAASRPIVPVFGRPLDELSAAVQADFQRRKRYLQYIIDQGQPIFTGAYMKPLIKAAANDMGDEAPPSVTSIYRWFRKYWSSKDPRALVPRLDLRGARGGKQGERLLQLLSDATEEACKASPLATAPMIYSKLLTKIETENGRSCGGQLLKSPSIRTIYRMLQNASAYELSRLRNGKAAADKRFRLVKVGTKTKQILERAEIDHTPLDLFLIDERTGLPLGRPTLTVVIDHFSRMLLGYYLSFGDPSAAAVMGALRHAILPKEPAEEVIANLKAENPWPCYGRPDVLVVDNGLEFHGQALESVAYDLNIRIQYCPKHQPQFKGAVERYLKTVNYFFCHQLPGTSFARLHQRGDYDPQKCAVLTLAEFKQLFEKWVVDDYAQRVHRGIGMAPWAKWQQGLKSRSIELPPNLRAFKKRIGLVSERSLRQDGIVISGIRYNGEALSPILRSHDVGVKVRVLYDPEDLGEILVWGPGDADPVSVLALDQEYAKDLTSRQNSAIRQILREQGAASEDKAALQRARAKLAQAVDDLMASRKQRDRRRAAAIRGMSSTNPDINLKAATPQPKPLRPKKATPSPNDESNDSARPLPLPTFKLKRSGGEGT